MAKKGQAETRVVSIVGRPNVGKSTLFNRLTRKRRALVDKQPGVTRDRLYGEVEANEERFTLVDTGGMTTDAGDPLLRQMRQQVETAVEESDLVLFLVDVRAGLMPDDEEIARWLREGGRPVLLVANKVDTHAREPEAAEFHQLGLGDPLPLSAEQGRGLGHLIDAVLELLPELTPREKGEEQAVRVAVMGRPNVGKSSIVNRLCGEERVLVHDEPGTTRDTTDTVLRHKGKVYRLLDTAGLRKRSRWKDRLEAATTKRSERTLKEADVVLIVIDASEGPTKQDAVIAGEADRAGCGVILVLNKWDLVEDREIAYDEAVRHMRWKLQHVDYAPVLTTSAKTGQRMSRILKLVDSIALNRARRIPTAELNRVLRALLERETLPGAGGRQFRLRYLTQTAAEPPTFIAFTTTPGQAPDTLRRFLIRRLREVFAFEGTPVHLRFKGKAGARKGGKRRK